jgi:hypothetical protein
MGIRADTVCLKRTVNYVNIRLLEQALPCVFLYSSVGSAYVLNMKYQCWRTSAIYVYKWAISSWWLCGLVGIQQN